MVPLVSDSPVSRNGWHRKIRYLLDLSCLPCPGNCVLGVSVITHSATILWFSPLSSVMSPTLLDLGPSKVLSPCDNPSGVICSSVSQLSGPTGPTVERGS